MTNPETTANLATPKLLSIKDFVKQNYYPNEGGIRAIIFNNTGNFNQIVVRRINRRIFLDTKAYYIWVNLQNGIKVA